MEWDRLQYYYGQGGFTGSVKWGLRCEKEMASVDQRSTLGKGMLGKGQSAGDPVKEHAAGKF